MDTDLRRYPKRAWLWLVLGRFGWLFAFLLAVGLLAMVASGLKTWEGRKFNLQSVDVTGEVTYLAVGAIPCSRDAGRCPQTLVRYRFETPDGPVLGEARIHRDYRPTLHLGGPIKLRYLAGSSAHQEVEIGQTFLQGIFGLIASGLIVLIGSCFGSYIWWANHMTRMRRNGLLCAAIVSAKGPEIDPFVGKWFVTWTDEHGRPGKSQWYGQAGFLPRAGSAIKVYCDPEGRKPAVWEGDSGTR